MIAPPAALGKSYVWARERLKNGQKATVFDHELVKRAHNNAQFPSIAGHAALG
jgi:hypothetical protein